MKEDHAVTNNDRKSQGVASATPAVTASNKESGNRKGEGRKKPRPAKLAHSAGQGK
jgi:hypothetical protein